MIYILLCSVRKIASNPQYNRDGYWIREFPEGLVVKEFSNGKVSIEPGQCPRPSLSKRILNKIIFVGVSY